MESDATRKMVDKKVDAILARPEGGCVIACSGCGIVHLSLEPQGIGSGVKHPCVPYKHIGVNILVSHIIYIYNVHAGVKHPCVPYKHTGVNILVLYI